MNTEKGFFVDIRNYSDRKQFINDILNNNYIKLKSNISSKEDIINSIFPISINLEKLEVDYIKNTTCAAAAITNKSIFITPEEALKRIKKEIEKLN